MPFFRVDNTMVHLKLSGPRNKRPHACRAPHRWTNRGVPMRERPIVFEPFVGIAPRQYQDIFDARDRRKDQVGKIFNWRAKGRRPEPRFSRFRNTYREIEDAIVAIDVPLLAQKLGVDLNPKTKSRAQSRRKERS